MKKAIVTLTASSLLIGSLGVVTAQTAQSSGETQIAQQESARGFGHGPRFGRDFRRGSGPGTI